MRKKCWWGLRRKHGWKQETGSWWAEGWKLKHSCGVKTESVRLKVVGEAMKPQKETKQKRRQEACSRNKHQQKVGVEPPAAGEPGGAWRKWKLKSSLCKRLLPRPPAGPPVRPAFAFAPGVVQRLQLARTHSGTDVTIMSKRQTSDSESQIFRTHDHKHMSGISQENRTKISFYSYVPQTLFFFLTRKNVFFIHRCFKTSIWDPELIISGINYDPKTSFI